MKHGPVRSISLVMLATLGFSFSGCGYLLHPERRGQRDGRIDAGVAVLDGLGLLLFVIPGVVAFVVDFSTGCIYLPGGRRSSLTTTDMRECRFDPHGATPATVERILRRETGIDVRLNGEQVRVMKLGSMDELPQRLARLNAESRTMVVAAANHRTR